jgi:hypothetical protein
MNQQILALRERPHNHWFCETSAVRQNGATSGIGVLASYGYDGLGRGTSLTRGNGMATSYAYTGPQLTSLSHDLAGSNYDVAFGFTYNPAGQIVTRTSSNTAYAYTAMGSGSLGYGINGLNQATAVGTTSVASDGRGNLTSDGTNSYTFSSDNRVTGLITGSITTALGYDPLGRWTKGGASIWLGWDGDAMVIEKLGSAATKWVQGAGGEPLLREHRRRRRFRISAASTAPSGRAPGGGPGAGGSARRRCGGGAEPACSSRDIRDNRRIACRSPWSRPAPGS